jgi:hypothetical protein
MVSTNSSTTDQKELGFVHEAAIRAGKARNRKSDNAGLFTIKILPEISPKNFTNIDTSAKSRNREETWLPD